MNTPLLLSSADHCEGGRVCCHLVMSMLFAADTDGVIFETLKLPVGEGEGEGEGEREGEGQGEGVAVRQIDMRHWG